MHSAETLTDNPVSTPAALYTMYAATATDASAS